MNKRALQPLVTANEQPSVSAVRARYDEALAEFDELIRRTNALIQTMLAREGASGDRRSWVEQD